MDASEWSSRKMTPFAVRLASKYLGGEVKLSKLDNASKDAVTEHSINMEVILSINFEGEQNPEVVMKYLTTHINEGVRRMLKDSQKQLGLDLVSADVKPVNIEYEVMSETGESSAFEAVVTPESNINHKDAILEQIMQVKHKGVEDLRAILDSKDYPSDPASSLPEETSEYEMIPSSKDDEEEFESYEESDEEDADSSLEDYRDEDEEVDEEDEDEDDEDEDEEDYEEDSDEDSDEEDSEEYDSDEDDSDEDDSDEDDEDDS